MGKFVVLVIAVLAVLPWTAQADDGRTRWRLMEIAPGTAHDYEVAFEVHVAGVAAD